MRKFLPVIIAIDIALIVAGIGLHRPAVVFLGIVGFVGASVALVLGRKS